MKLHKKQILLVSFMLFSLFFGAGNLIFPPFLGQNAGSQTPFAIAAFLITAVALPVLGVIVVAKFDGLEKLARRVNPKFAIVFTILIYLSIGPGLGIPRAASLPFEMAVAPYLPEEANLSLFMLGFSLVFFLIAGWLALTPNKLVERIGKFLTPSLLFLLLFVFFNFLLKGNVHVAEPQESYASNPLVKGFLEGYLTMDTIAALNFGLVIATTITGLGISRKSDVMKYTVMTGIFRRLSDPGLYGHEFFRCIPDSGKRRMDSALHRASALRGYGRHPSGSYLYAGLPDNLRGTDHLYFPVFFNPDFPAVLPPAGSSDRRFFLCGLQSGAQCDLKHFRTCTGCYLSHFHHADRARTV